MDFRLVPMQACPGPLKTPLYVDAELSICVGSPHIRCLVGIPGPLQCCERHLPPIVCREAHYLRFGLLKDRKPERRARSHDHHRYPFQPSW